MLRIQRLTVCLFVLGVGDCLHGESYLLSPNAAGRYDFQVLSSPYPERTEARALNELGTVVGYFRGENHTPVKWVDGELHILPTFAGDPSAIPYGINDAGVIAGQSFPRPLNLGRAVLWQDDTIFDLGTLGGEGAGATDINERGEVAGTSRLAGEEDLQPFLWAPEEGMQFLGNLADGSFPSHVARAINERSVIVGISSGKAFRWSSATGIVDLGLLADYEIASATDINDLGQIVGWNRQLQGIDVAVVWNPGQGPQVLHDFEGMTASAAAINNHGAVVGSYGRSTDRTLAAFLWREGVAYTLNDLADLPDPHIRLQTAIDINDRGQIIGRFAIVPEPQAWTTLAVAAGILLMARRSPWF